MKHTPKATRRSLLGITLIGTAVAPAVQAVGRPVVIIAPFTPGAPPDVVARILADGLQQRQQRTYVVENRPGASGIIGAGYVARSAPDGETLMVYTTSLVMSAKLYDPLPYDPLASFAPVTELVDVDYVLVLHPSGGATLEEFIAKAHAQPGVLNYASPGVGTPHHLTMELLRQQASLDVAHVPYRGTAGAVTAVLSGEVQAMFMPVNGAVEIVRGDMVRNVATAAPGRLSLLPDVPTLAERGFPGVMMRDWFALFAPAGLPDAQLDRLAAEANAVIATPGIAANLRAQGFDPIGGSPASLKARMTADFARWSKLIQERGIRLD